MSLQKIKDRVEKAESIPWHEGKALGLLQYRFPDPVLTPEAIQSMIDALYKEFGDIDDGRIEKVIMQHFGVSPDNNNYNIPANAKHS